MTPTVYSFVFRPKFVFWLSLVVAASSTGVAILALSTFTHKNVERVEHAKEVVSDTILRQQVNEIFTRVRNIETLAIKANAKTDYNTVRIDRLEQKK